MKFSYCPKCNEVRVHPQPFYDSTGRFLCGACWFIDQKEVEMELTDNILDVFPNHKPCTKVNNDG